MYFSSTFISIFSQNALTSHPNFENMTTNPTQIRRTLGTAYEPSEAAALSRIVCTEMLGQSQADYFLCKDIELSANQEENLQSILERLLRFEPIQYVQGFSWFLSRRFFVTPAVLIPRPETEELVQRIIEETEAGAAVLDVGTGSGCIAISLALSLPKSKVEAWDVSMEALEVAMHNAEQLHAQVDFHLQDMLTCQWEGGQRYDLIVSNPPYVLEQERTTMSPNVVEYEPELALFVPDDDPLLFYRKIGEMGRRALKSGGRLYFEINRTQGIAVKQLLEKQGYSEVFLYQDISHNDRLIKACL